MKGKRPVARELRGSGFHNVFITLIYICYHRCMYDSRDSNSKNDYIDLLI